MLALSSQMSRPSSEGPADAIDQCVGDTLCAGGIMYGQRTMAAMLDFCKDIREVGKPGVLMLNYSNPMAMNTWACNQFGKVNTVGLCHGVQGAHWQIDPYCWPKRLRCGRFFYARRPVSRYTLGSSRQGDWA